MSGSIDEFDFSQLSVDERILLAQELWESVHDEAQAKPIPADQRAELDRRLAELESGEVQGIPWEAVRRQLRSRP